MTERGHAPPAVLPNTWMQPALALGLAVFATLVAIHLSISVFA